jgi:hypothetical protein
MAIVTVRTERSEVAMAGVQVGVDLHPNVLLIFTDKRGGTCRASGAEQLAMALPEEPRSLKTMRWRPYPRTDHSSR